MKFMSPETIDDLIGQERLKPLLARYIAAAKEGGQPFPDCLLTGPSGDGKSTVAEVISRAMGGNYLRIRCSSKLRFTQLYEEVTKLNFGDVLHLDEAQSGSPQVLEAIYDIVDKRIVPFSDGKRIDPFRPISISRFTVLVSTNEPGALKAPLRNRLVDLQLEPYDSKHMHDLLIAGGAQSGINFSQEAAELLVKISQLSPRKLIKIVGSGLMVLNPGVVAFEKPHVEELMKFWGINEIGLDSNQRRYLKALKHFGGRARLIALTAFSGLHRSDITGEIEPQLMRMGILTREEATAMRILLEKPGVCYG